MKRIDLNMYKPANNVTYINSDPYRFTYRIQSLTSDDVFIKHIDIPTNLRDQSLFIAFAMYSKTRWFTELASGSQWHHAKTLEYLIDFFSVNKQLLINKNDRAISTHFLVHVRDTQGKSADSFKRQQSVIMRVLAYATSVESDFFLSEYYDDYLKQLKNQEVTIQADRGPKKTFTNVFNTDFTDDQILISMRKVLTWFMRTMSSIRKGYLTNNPSLALELHRIFDDGKTPLLNNSMRMARNGMPSIKKVKGNGYHLRAMLNLKSEIVNESMLLSMKRFNKKLTLGARYTTWQIRRELEAQFFHKGLLRYVEKTHDRTDFLTDSYHSLLEKGEKPKTLTQSVLPIGMMFSPTLAERKALAWLAASDRLQSSALDKLKLDDMIFDGFDSEGVPSQLQVKYSKKRAHRGFVSPIYKRGIDELFDVYYDFYLLRMNEGKYFSSPDRPGYLMPSKMNKLYMRGDAIGQHTTLPLLLLGMPGTIMQKKCLAEVEMAKPFLDVLTQTVDGSTRYRNSRSLYKNTGTGEVEHSNLPISLDLIAQTRAVMEDEEDDDPNVTAESAAHSYETHDQIYLKRSDISKKPGSNIHRFGADVGDKIYELAKRMKKIAIGEPGYNRERVIEALGLTSFSARTLEGSNELNDVINRAKESGLGAGLIENVSAPSDTIIIQDPIIAAIIISYKNHLERIKEQLTQDKKEVELKLATSHQIYLESLLEKFHRKHIRKANEIAEQLTLPYRAKL